MIALHQLVALRLRTPPQHRRAARVASAPRLPKGAELFYLGALRAIMGDVHEVIRRELLPHIGEVARVDARGTSRLHDRFRGVRASVLDIVTEERVGRAAGTAVRKIDKHNVDDQRRVLGISVRKLPGLDGVVQDFEHRNALLIKSLALDEIDRVEQIVDGAQVQGLRYEEIADQLEHAFDVSDSKAAFIARDRVLKANGQITQFRQQAAGVTEYVWSTSHDERVRPEHAKLDGKRQQWASPPQVDKNGRREHPGQDYQCRCVPAPFIEF